MLCGFCLSLKTEQHWTQTQNVKSHLCLSWSRLRPRCIWAFWFWCPVLKGDGNFILTFPWHKCLSLSSSHQQQDTEDSRSSTSLGRGLGGKATLVGGTSHHLHQWLFLRLCAIPPSSCHVLTKFHWRLREMESTQDQEPRLGFRTLPALSILASFQGEMSLNLTHHPAAGLSRRTDMFHFSLSQKLWNIPKSHTL